MSSEPKGAAQILPNTPLYSTPPGSNLSPERSFVPISSKKRRYSQGPKAPIIPEPTYALSSFQLDQKRLKTESSKRLPDLDMKIKKNSSNSNWTVQLPEEKSMPKYVAPNIIPEKKKKVQFTSDGQITGSTSTSGADSELHFAENPTIKLLEPKRISSKILNEKRLRLNLRKNINKSFDFHPRKPDKIYTDRASVIDTKETRAKLMKLQKKYRKTQERYQKLTSQKKNKKK